MDQVYDAHGIRFQFPDDWEVTEQRRGTEIWISAESPYTAFWCLGLFPDRPHAEHVIESALESFCDEYDDLDIYPSDAQQSDARTVARDLEFVSMDLINSAFLRAFETEAFTALVLFQANDAELEETRPIFEKMCRSLAWDCGI